MEAACIANLLKFRKSEFLFTFQFFKNNRVMNRSRLIFYSVFGLFHLSAFIFTVMLDNDTSLLFKMVRYVPSFKWLTLFGLLMLVADVVWLFMVHRTSAKEKAALTLELNTLKAKLFDLQEAAKKQVVSNDSKK
jgi:hypothetical protein